MFATMNLLPARLPHLKVAARKFVHACDAKLVKRWSCEGPVPKDVKYTINNKAHGPVVAAASLGFI